MPKSVNELIEKPKALMNAKVPIRETGIVTAGIIVARQSSRKKKMTIITITIASSSVRDDFFHRVANNRGRIERDDIGHARRERLLQLQQRCLGLLIDLQRIRIRKLLHADADRRVPAKQQIAVIRFGPNLGSAHVLQLHDSVAELS